MKKLLLPFFSIVSAGALLAQEPADALRFSWAVPGGTARSQAIGGAMGSLGGDISATFVNPAGLGLYKTGDVVLSPKLFFGNAKSTYFGRTEKSNLNKFAWGTTGFVAGLGSDYRNTKNVAISLAYNRSADFNSNILYRGVNNLSSFSQQYVDELNASGRRDSTITYEFPYGSSLAFNTYWVDPAYDSSGKVTGFKTKFPPGTELLQQQQLRSSGGINEFALGVGASLNENLLLGGSISVPVLNYSRTSTFREEDPTTDVTNAFDFAEVYEEVSTKGVGVNAKLGLIFKPVDYLRLGLAFHTPTLYSLKDVYDIVITTDAETSDGVLSDYMTDYTNGQPTEFSYLLITPYRAIASASYVLREVEDVTKQKGFITADIEYVNYRTSSFQAEDEATSSESDLAYLESLNAAIDNAYKSAFNFRIGGELKFTTLMVRAGAAYYGNPYQNINGEKGHKLNVSGGLGYRHKGMFVDLTYVHAMNKDVHFSYRTSSAPYAGAGIKSGMGNVLATVGFKF
jgi:hypothetical protein